LSENFPRSSFDGLMISSEILHFRL